MTEKEAVLKTIKMWEKLKEFNTENPRTYIVDLKIKYFNLIRNAIPDYSIPLNYCYLCEFTDGDCRKCPVKNWSVYRKYGEICEICTECTSVYRLPVPEKAINNVLEVLKETYNNLYNN